MPAADWGRLQLRLSGEGSGDLSQPCWPAAVASHADRHTTMTILKFSISILLFYLDTVIQSTNKRKAANKLAALQRIAPLLVQRGQFVNVATEVFF